MKSMKLFQLWRELHHEPEKLQREKEKLLEGAPEPSFAKRFQLRGCVHGKQEDVHVRSAFFWLMTTPLRAAREIVCARINTHTH